VVICRGTSPSQAARSRALAESSASPIAAVNAVALSAPMPGIVASRRAGAELRRRLDELAVERRNAGVELGPLPPHLLEEQPHPQAQPRPLVRRPRREASEPRERGGKTEGAA
jgi:hypothetical protein